MGLLIAPLRPEFLLLELELLPNLPWFPQNPPPLLLLIRPKELPKLLPQPELPNRLLPPQPEEEPPPHPPDDIGFPHPEFPRLPEFMLLFPLEGPPRPPDTMELLLILLFPRPFDPPFLN